MRIISAVYSLKKKGRGPGKVLDPARGPYVADPCFRASKLLFNYKKATGEKQARTAAEQQLIAKSINVFLTCYNAVAVT